MTSRNSPSLTFTEAEGVVRETISGGFSSGGYTTVAEMCLKQALDEFRRCGCRGCRAAEPHFVAALAELRKAVGAAAVAKSGCAPTVHGVGRA